MCLHGVKAQEGAVLGGVGPARRGRAGQRWGGGGAEIAGPDGLRAVAPRHSALRGGGAGPAALCTEGESCAAVRGPCAASGGAGAGAGRCGQVRAGRGGRGAGPGSPGRRRLPAPGEPGLRGQQRQAARDQCPCGGRGRGGMELPEGPASRPCGCAAAAEEQVRGILT